jgi:nucleoside-diphosphate-sugar epimerase
VVLTSSFAAIGYGNKEASTTLTEETWTNPNQKGVSAYAKSKTLAEMAAWDWIASQGGSLELAVINPVMVCGPLLGSDLSMSVDIVKKQLDGALPGLPHVYMGVVDVRDVADLHLVMLLSLIVALYMLLLHT